MSWGRGRNKRRCEVDRGLRRGMRKEEGGWLGKGFRPKAKEGGLQDKGLRSKAKEGGWQGKGFRSKA